MQVAAADGAASAAADTLASLVSAEDDCVRQSASLAQQLQRAKTTEGQLHKKVGRLAAASATAEVAITSAAAARQDHEHLLAALQGLVARVHFATFTWRW